MKQFSRPLAPLLNAVFCFLSETNISERREYEKISTLYYGMKFTPICLQVSFCMLVISFYFVNCVIISFKLSFSSRFTRIKIKIMSFLDFQKAELGCK